MEQRESSDMKGTGLSGGGGTQHTLRSAPATNNNPGRGQATGMGAGRGGSIPVTCLTWLVFLGTPLKGSRILTPRQLAV